MSTIYIDQIFQPYFESYCLTLGGQLALFAPVFRQQFQPKHSFSVASKISQDAWIVFKELFDLLSNKKGTWRATSAVAPCQFLSFTWEVLVKDNRYPKISIEPMVQYFRHIRNAASHGNQFKIDDDLIDTVTNSLKRKAEWRGVEITPNLRGVTLIPDYMEMADPIWLISDVSNLLKTVI